jgi:hypothetical protein
MPCLLAGLLRAYSAAATAASRFLSAHAQPPHTHTTQPVNEQTILQLMDNPIHLFAGASSSLLLLWNTLADLVPIAELLPAGSLLLGSAVIAASLALALARAYAGDQALCGPVMFHVLTTALMLARAAVSGPPDKQYSTLACKDVHELLLLCFAVGTGLLHGEYKGTSKQSLLRSMRVTSSSSSSIAGSSSSKGNKDSKPGRLAVSAHHEQLLHAVIGVRQLPPLQQHTASSVLRLMWLIPLAVCEAGRMRMPQVPGSVSWGEVVPWRVALPLLLTQVELVALAPTFLAEQLTVLLQMLALMTANLSGLRTWTHTQQQPRDCGTLQSQLRLLVQALWLQLGPALLSLCRRSSGEAVGEEDQEGPGSACKVYNTASGQPLEAAPPRQVFATFSAMLVNAVTWHGGCA